MDINRPEIVAEVTAAFTRYEAAFVANDVAALDAFFVDHPTTIRYGIAEHQHGLGEIRAFRRTQPGTDLARRLGDTVITTYGADVGIASTLFFRDSAPGKIGRQMQTWIRTGDGWQVAAAHVSMIDAPA